MLGAATAYLARPGSQPPRGQNTPKHQIELHRNLAQFASHPRPSHDERLCGAIADQSSRPASKHD
jgi:hypothetical protein